jgi:uncharacterized protein (TIGR00369 family)
MKGDQKLPSGAKRSAVNQRRTRMMRMLDNPFLATLGARVISWEEHRVKIELKILKHHLNRHGNVQGGVMAALLDVACGYAGLHSPMGGPLKDGVTLQLSIAYLDNCKSGTLIAEGIVERTSSQVYFSRAELRNDGAPRRTLAIAQGVFKYRRAS